MICSIWIDQLPHTEGFCRDVSIQDRLLPGIFLIHDYQLEWVVDINRIAVNVVDLPLALFLPGRDAASECIWQGPKRSCRQLDVLHDCVLAIGRICDALHRLVCTDQQQLVIAVDLDYSLRCCCRFIRGFRCCNFAFLRYRCSRLLCRDRHRGRFRGGSRLRGGDRLRRFCRFRLVRGCCRRF